MSNGVEWAVHCCVVLSEAEGPVSTHRLAEFHEISPTYLAKHLQQLARAGLVASIEGRSGGYTLTRAAHRITVFDIVSAIEGRESSFRCSEIRQNGPLPASRTACRRACGIARVMYAADKAWRDSLKGVTVSDLAATIEMDAGPHTFDKLRAWLGGEPA